MVKHQATKVPYNQLLASEWNEEHLITAGLDSAKPTSGLVVNQIYYATDTKRLYRAISSTSWEIILRDDHAVRHVDGGDDEITSKLDFRAMNIAAVKSAGTSTFSTTSTTWVDITGMATASLQVPYQAFVFVSAGTYEIKNTGSPCKCVATRIMRDSTAIIVQNFIPTDQDEIPLVIQKMDSVSAGNYVYKLQGACTPTCGGTSYWYMSSELEFQGYISAMAFKS
jgi:hypothetical protein